MTTSIILSDNGASSGSSGLKTSGGNDGTLQLQTTTSGGVATTAMTIDTSQKVSFTNPIQGGSITSGTAVASTSGTSIDFTSIPSWVKRITIMWKGVSTSGTSLPVIQLGTGGTPTYTTSGYLAASVNQVGTFTNFTNGFGIYNAVLATNIMTGTFVLVLQDLSTNTWVCSHSIVNTVGGNASWGDGYVSLSGALTAVRNTTTNGTDTFDAGSINILYEG
jgi:hypothetical protein